MHLRFKRQFNRGFTLMEMLIVVAIIVVLISIGVPLIGDKLDRSKQIADNANVKAAYSEALTQQTLTQIKTVRWVKTPMEANYDGKTTFYELEIKTPWKKGDYVKIVIDGISAPYLSTSQTLGSDEN